MKMKPVAVPVIVLLASFLAAIAPCTPAMAASPSLWISGTPASGQFNNGLISPVGPDATAPSTKLYYLSSSSPSSRPRVGLTLRGAGFEPDTSVGFGIEGKQNEPTEPWGTGTYSLPAPVMTDSNGDFEYSVTFSRASPSAYNKFDVDGGEKLIIYPTYPNDKSSENPDGRIDGVQVALTIHPTVILLPRALDAVTMYAGTDYSISGAEDNGVASMIIIDDSSRQVRLAVAGMSLRGPGNANIPRENETWRLSNGVTAAANADNSYIVLRTPESGVSGEMNGMFSVLGTGASVVSDGFASVAGFPKTSEALIATFSLQVKKSDRSASPEHSSFVFKNNEAVNASVIFETTFNTTPQNLAIGDLLIVDPATKQRVKSLSVLGGLVMTADSGRRAVTFSGTPVIEGGEGEGSYDVVWITTDGEALPSTIDVNVSAGDVYAPGYTDDVIGDGYIPESRPYWRTGKSVPETPRGIRVLKADGSEVPLKLTVDDDHGLEGLDIKVDSDNKGITISGTPTFSGLKTFYVEVAIDPAGGVSGTVSPSRVPFSVFVDDVTYYQLSFDKEKLEVPVGKEFHANVNQITEPTYGRDSSPRVFTLTGDGVSGGPGVWHWNGLTITDIENTATWNSWLEVSGKAEREGSVELTYSPSRGDNMSSAKFTIVAHKDEDVADTTAETEVVTNPGDPIVISSADVRYENAVAGEATKVIYVISGASGGEVTVDNYVNIQMVCLEMSDGRTIPLLNLNDYTAANPFNGAANYYSFDRASGQIVLYLTPEVIGEYRCNVYYKGAAAAALNVHPITLNVKRTTNYYYTEEKSGGGGCDAGAAAWLAAMSAAAAFLLCRPRRKR